jgi:hypothetical protein
VAQGLPLAELADDPQVGIAFGGEQALGDIARIGKPKELIILAGIRTGKSLLTAAMACYASQTVDVSGLRPGEIPRVSVLSLTKNHATVVLNHLLGSIEASPLLKLLVVGEPKAESLFLRHPSGCMVEIAVVPIDRAGGSVVARWSAGCILDEAPRMQSEQEGVLNYDQVRNAVLERLLPGSTLISVGSPWAPRGDIYKRYNERFGFPGEDLVIVKAQGPAMNPKWWTPERCEKAKRNPIVYKTDVLGEFADPEATLFTSTVVEQCVRPSAEDLPYNPRAEYVAAMDPATRGNSWPLVIVTQEGGVKKVAAARQWTGSKGAPLDPDKVMGEIAMLCRKYELDVVTTDQWSSDALAAVARRWGLSLSVQNTTRESRYENFDKMHKLMMEGKVQIPNIDLMKSDLMAIRKKVTHNGIDIYLPRTGDGRHADFAFALAIALRYTLDDPVPEMTPEERERAERDEKKRKLFEKKDAQENPWWGDEKTGGK